MQDLTGHIMNVDSKAWDHVVIRQKYEAGDEQAVPEDPRTQDGELLFPQRFPAWVVEEEERNPAIVPDSLASTSKGLSLAKAERKGQRNQIIVTWRRRE